MDAPFDFMVSETSDKHKSNAFTETAMNTNCNIKITRLGLIQAVGTGVSSSIKARASPHEEAGSFSSGNASQHF